MARTTTLNNQSQHLSLYQRSNEAETPTFLYPFLPSHSQNPQPEEPFKNLSHRLSFDEFSIKRTCEYFMIAAFHSRARRFARRPSQLHKRAKETPPRKTADGEENFILRCSSGVGAAQRREREVEPLPVVPLQFPSSFRLFGARKHLSGCWLANDGDDGRRTNATRQVPMTE